MTPISATSELFVWLPRPSCMTRTQAVFSSPTDLIRPSVVTSEVRDEEAAWIARARNGEEAAQRWLVDTYRHRVLRLANHILRRPDEAEDVAQEALIRALTRLHSYRGEAAFSTWLLRIATRACIDHTRRRTVRREVPLESSAAEIPTSRGQSVDARLLVAALLDGLTPPLRAALVLRELEGLSYEEISSALNVPVGTVRSRISAARTRFRELYEAAEKEADHV